MLSFYNFTLTCFSSRITIVSIFDATDFSLTIVLLYFFPLETHSKFNINSYLLKFTASHWKVKIVFVSNMKVADKTLCINTLIFSIFLSKEGI